MCVLCAVRPLSVEILGSAAAPVSAGKTYHLVCRTFGSRPAANISWWIGDRRLTGDSQAVRTLGDWPREGMFGRGRLLVDRRQTAHGRLTGGEDTGRLTERGDVRKR